MPPPDKAPPADRDQTDTSLRTEREKTDDELEKVRANIEEDADAVVQRAREKADETLELARSKADETLGKLGASSEAKAMARRERASEDRTLTSERAVSDLELEEEREHRGRALEAILRLEREQTDSHLLVERARSDEALIQRDDFLGMVSHDLRTILGGIALGAALLIRNAADDEPGRATRKIGESIERYSARMNRLVGDLIDVTSIEFGRLAILPERHDAAKTLQDAMEAFQPLADAKGISLHHGLVKGPLFALFDHQRVLQVLGNLLSNAIKFTPPKGSIQVLVQGTASEVRFSVSDTGIGVPADKREAVFERFWQVKANDGRGLGLGLFISKCIVEAHGGKIWVEDTHGPGSIFSFTLPAAPG